MGSSNVDIDVLINAINQLEIERSGKGSLSTCLDDRLSLRDNALSDVVTQFADTLSWWARERSSSSLPLIHEKEEDRQKILHERLGEYSLQYTELEEEHTALKITFDELEDRLKKSEKSRTTSESNCRALEKSNRRLLDIVHTSLQEQKQLKELCDRRKEEIAQLRRQLNKIKLAASNEKLKRHLPSSKRKDQSKSRSKGHRRTASGPPRRDSVSTEGSSDVIPPEDAEQATRLQEVEQQAVLDRKQLKLFSEEKTRAQAALDEARISALKAQEKATAIRYQKVLDQHRSGIENLTIQNQAKSTEITRLQDEAQRLKEENQHLRSETGRKTESTKKLQNGYNKYK